MVEADCMFCKIVSKELESEIIFEDDCCVVFLDHRPIFYGHTLVLPKSHIQTLDKLPQEMISGLFGAVQKVERAVVYAMEAEGSFVAINNNVSQSVPHLHIHVVPRRKGDGLKGFFWPRTKYNDNNHELQVADKIRAVMESSETEH